MICSNCNKRIKKTLIKCPFCGARIINKESFDLPQLKPVEEKEPVVSPSPSTENKEIIELSPIDYNLSDNDYGVELNTSSNESEDFDKFAGIEADKAEKEDSEESKESNLINEDLLLGKTIRIDLEEESSLMDDISSEIEKMAEEDVETISPSKPIEDETSFNETFSSEEQNSKDDLQNDSSSNSENDTVSEDNENNGVDITSPAEENLEDEETTSSEEILSSKASIKKRRKIFIISILSVLILTIVIYSLYSLYENADHTNTTPNTDISKELEPALTEALENYYVTGIVDDVVSVLETIKDDEEKITEAQTVTKEIASKWVTSYYEKEIESKEDFEKESERIKDQLNDLHVYGIVKKDATTIKSLTDEAYQELIKKVNDIYNDSATYFDAYELYNERDYNKAYATFDKIKSTDRYYSKSLTAKDRVVNDVILLLKKDIEMLKVDINSLNDEEKLARYIEIEEIIFEYKNVYHSVDLESNEEYQALLKEYSDVIDEYSEITTTPNTSEPDETKPKYPTDEETKATPNDEKSNEIIDSNESSEGK